MADRDFKIRITTEADLAAAKETAAGLQDVGGKGTKAHEDIAEAAEKSHVSHRALNLALRQMGPEFQHLGHLAVYGLSNPMVAGLLAATAVAGALIHVFEELGKAQEEAAKKAADASKNMIDSMRAAREEVIGLSAETGTVVKNLDSVIAKLKEVKEPEKGLRTKEEVEKAIRDVSGQLSEIDQQSTPEERLRKIQALPAIAAAHDKEAEEEKKLAATYSNDPNAQAPGSRRAVAAEKATEESLAAIRARDELSFLKEEAARRKDLDAQLTHLSEMHEKLDPRDSRAAQQGVGFPRGSIFPEAITGATANSRQQGPTTGQQHAEVQLAELLKQQGMSNAKIVEFFHMLASDQISLRQKLEAIQQQMKSGTRPLQ
jgi:hypothetical protein